MESLRPGCQRRGPCLIRMALCGRPVRERDKDAPHTTTHGRRRWLAGLAGQAGDVKQAKVRRPRDHHFNAVFPQTFFAVAKADKPAWRSS